MAQADNDSSSLARTLDAYVAGRKGVDFDALSVFAEPLFDLYDLDLRNVAPAGSLQADPEELSGLVAVLDTARLFWAYFALGDDSAQKHAHLEDALIGPSPSEDERGDFLQLMSIMEDQWHALTPSERDAAASVEDSMPPFDQLLSEYVSSPANEDLGNFGEDALDMPEALALFAQPLTDTVDDPDEIDDALSRAQAYWDVAMAPPGERDARLEQLKKSLASSAEEEKQLEAESAMMLHRFFELFPDQQS